MLRVGICDDTKMYRDMVEKICHDTLKNSVREYEVITFENGNDFFKHDKEFDLVILDIQMPEMSGIDIKKKLEDLDSHTFIIYMTHYSEFVLDAFGLNVIGFILKEDLETMLSEKIDIVLKKINKNVKVNGLFDSMEIQYIRSRRSYCEIHFVNGEKEVIPKKPLNAYEEELAKADFVRVHNSYLVNLRWVERVHDYQAFFKNSSVPIAKRRWGKVNNKWLDYDG